MRSTLGSAALGLMVLALSAAIALDNPEDVTLEISQEIYEPGDSVFFTMTNHSKAHLMMGNRPPWHIHELGTGELVWPFGGCPSELYLYSGESLHWNWDQTQFGDPVAEGLYYIQIGFQYGISGPGPWDVVRDTFEITNQNPLKPASWGEIKALMK